MELKGSKTEKNILMAFAGESQARNRYTYFASEARKEGYIQIADIFEETANQEKEHAKRFFKFLEGGEVEIQTSFPAGVIGKRQRTSRPLRLENITSGLISTRLLPRLPRKRVLEMLRRLFQLLLLLRNSMKNDTLAF
jgi:hypothetical protein